MDTHHEVCSSKLLSDVCLKKRKYKAGSVQSSCSTTTDCHWLSSSQQLRDCVAPRGTMYVGCLSPIATVLVFWSTGERVLQGSIVVDHCQSGFLPSMQALQAYVQPTPALTFLTYTARWGTAETSKLSYQQIWQISTMKEVKNICVWCSGPPFEHNVG